MTAKLLEDIKDKGLTAETAKRAKTLRSNGCKQTFNINWAARMPPRIHQINVKVASPVLVDKQGLGWLPRASILGGQHFWAFCQPLNVTTEAVNNLRDTSSLRQACAMKLSNSAPTSRWKTQRRVEKLQCKHSSSQKQATAITAGQHN
eukprot:2051785-Amphidinium_carterae.1